MAHYDTLRIQLQRTPCLRFFSVLRENRVLPLRAQNRAGPMLGTISCYLPFLGVRAAGFSQILCMRMCLPLAEAAWNACMTSSTWQAISPLALCFPPETSARAMSETPRPRELAA